MHGLWASKVGIFAGVTSKAEKLKKSQKICSAKKEARKKKKAHTIAAATVWACI